MLWHRHRWRAIGTFASFFSPSFGASSTVVLYHCTICPKVRTEELKGAWTLAQIQEDEEEEQA